MIGSPVDGLLDAAGETSAASFDIADHLPYRLPARDDFDQEY